MLLYKFMSAGYFELNTQSKDAELAYFGLLHPFVGIELGGGLLSTTIENAWGT